MGDARRVKGVKNIKNALQKLKALAPVQFKDELSDAFFKSGFLAQDIEKIFPEFVLKARGDNGTAPIQNRPGFTGWALVSLEVIVPWIVSALQELSEDLDQTKKKLNRFGKEAQDRVVALETKVAALETLIAQNASRFQPIQTQIDALDERLDELEAQ